jgi:hypothetical protein
VLLLCTAAGDQCKKLLVVGIGVGIMAIVVRRDASGTNGCNSSLTTEVEAL